MVNVGGWSKPELGAVFAAGEHDTEIVFARPEKLTFLFLCELRYTANQ